MIASGQKASFTSPHVSCSTAVPNRGRTNVSIQLAASMGRGPIAPVQGLGEQRVTPRILAAISSPRRRLPFGLGRQTLSCPLTEVACIEPGIGFTAMLLR